MSDELRLWSLERLAAEAEEALGKDDTRRFRELEAERWRRARQAGRADAMAKTTAMIGRKLEILTRGRGRRLEPGREPKREPDPELDRATAGESSASWSSACCSS
jgi:hypothetical protein